MSCSRPHRKACSGSAPASSATTVVDQQLSVHAVDVAVPHARRHAQRDGQIADRTGAHSHDRFRHRGDVGRRHVVRRVREAQEAGRQQLILRDELCEMRNGDIRAGRQGDHSRGHPWQHRNVRGVRPHPVRRRADWFQSFDVGGHVSVLGARPVAEQRARVNTRPSAT